LDLSKAFDKVSKYELFTILITKHIPVLFIQILINWYDKIQSCVRWGTALSHTFKLETGVTQGGVLLPILFVLYIDDLVNDLNDKKCGCFINGRYCGILLYADDIVMSSSEVELQHMIDLVTDKLDSLDKLINAKKSGCIRVGNRYNIYQYFIRRRGSQQTEHKIQINNSWEANRVQQIYHINSLS